MACSAARLDAQTTLGFDDLAATSSFAIVPDGYGGLNYSNVDYINQSYLPGSGYDLGTVSPPNAAFNAFGNVASITTQSGFLDFDSVDLTAAFIPGLSVTVDGYNTNVSSSPIYTRTVTLDTASPTLFDFDSGGDFTGVNKLVFTPAAVPAGTEFALDNFTFTPTTIGASVPEPTSLLLAAIGIAGALLLGVRRKQRAAA